MHIAAKNYVVKTSLRSRSFLPSRSVSSFWSTSFLTTCNSSSFISLSNNNTADSRFEFYKDKKEFKSEIILPIFSGKLDEKVNILVNGKYVSHWEFTRTGKKS